MSLKFETLSPWLEYIESLHPNEIELGLDRVQEVAARLGVEQNNAKKVLVGGTNGKGSCCAMLESLALGQRLQVGCYTSPHLVTFNERIRVNGQNVTDQVLIEAFEQIESCKGQTSLTFFEFTTLAAMLIFKRFGVELMIMEIGLGGRKDACNIIEPDVSVITTIEKDHIAWLGDSFESIAYEKAGILRKNKPGLIGDQRSFKLISSAEPELSDTIVLVKSPTDAFARAIEDSTINSRRLLTQNIMLAVASFERLFSLSLSDQQTVDALRNVSIQGRFQIVSDEPLIILDVAHNFQSAQNLAFQLAEFKCRRNVERVTAICGMMADKAINQVLEVMNDVVDEWIFVDLEIGRAAKAQHLLTQYSLLNHAKPARVAGSVEIGYQQYLPTASNKDLLLVFGSFITVGNMVQYAQDESIIVKR